MRTKGLALSGALCLIVGVGALGAHAQATSGQAASPQLIPRTPQQREQTYEANRRIILNVNVTDAAGKPVDGLKAEDFTILDHGQAQKIVTWQELSGSRNRGAVHGIVVLDAINGGGSGVKRASKELTKFLEQGKGPLAFPLQVVVVSDLEPNEGQPSTDPTSLVHDLGQLTQHVHSEDCNSTQTAADIADSRIGGGMAAGAAPGGSASLRWQCLNRQLMESLNSLNQLAGEQQNTKGRAILIWTGPGWPLPPPVSNEQIMGGAGAKGSLSDAVFSLATDLREGQVTLDAISWGSFERAKGLRRTDVNGNLKDASISEQEAAVSLPVLAEQSGGRAMEKSKNLAEAVNECLSDGEGYYALSFDPARAAAQGEYRTIEVKVDKPEVKVRAATGYYAEP